MILVDNLEELIRNLDTVESYLNGDNEELFYQMADLIRRGRNFVAYDVNGNTHFAPSRFVGYKDNTLPKHLKKGNGKDGSLTSAKLRTNYMLGQDEKNSRLQKEWERYCKECGVVPTDGVKTFWILKDDYETPFLEDFAEGNRYYSRHLAYERNHAAVRKAKEQYIRKYGCVCQICGFDFIASYGELGRDYIEAHHTRPVSEMKKGDVTRVEDLAMICANCHRMIHRRKPLLQPEDLKKILGDCAKEITSR